MKGGVSRGQARTPSYLEIVPYLANRPPTIRIPQSPLANLEHPIGIILINSVEARTTRSLARPRLFIRMIAKGCSRLASGDCGMRIVGGGVTKRTMFSIALVLTLFGFPISSQAQAIYAENRRPAAGVRVEYTLTITDPLSHLSDIQVDVSGIRSDTVDVALPAWSPGLYFILNYARNIQRFDAVSSQGNPLHWEQIDKQTWHIAKAVTDDIRVSYQVYSADLTDEMAEVSAPATFMYVVGQKHAPVTARYNVPPRWQVYSGLEKTGDRLQATDYDVFVDAPAFIGDFKVLEFESASGAPHRVVFSNPRLEMTDQQVVADLRDLVNAATRVFGRLPYKDYTFLVKVVTGPVTAGLEHLNSSRINVGPDDFVNQTGYRRFLGAAAHNLAHVWNGKRIRPQAFAPLDYSKETYSK